MSDVRLGTGSACDLCGTRKVRRSWALVCPHCDAACHRGKKCPLCPKPPKGLAS